jgi:hypothetical protein
MLTSLVTSKPATHEASTRKALEARGREIIRVIMRDNRRDDRRDIE